MPHQFGPAATKFGRTLRHPIQELGLAAVVGSGVGFVVGAALVLVLHFTNVLSGPGHRQVEPFSEVPPTMAASLAARFRPWLLFDTHEHWQPLNVDSLLDQGTHKFCRGAGNADCVLIANHGEFGQLVRQTPELGAHLNLDGSSVGQYRGSATCAPSSLFDCGTGPGSAIYYHVTDSNDRFYIDYWWFLRFNHFAITKSLCLSQALQKASVCDEHEGDWEGVTVVTPPNDPSRAAYVVYAAHKGSFRYSTTSLQMKGPDRTRPVVYLASGSHAAYPIPCTGDLCFQPVGLAAGGLFDIPDGRYNGALSWPRNPDAQCDVGGAGSCLISLSDQPWTNWPGQWGDGCESACGGAGDVNSPQSPGLQSRYQTPWCSTETVGVTCDGRVVTCSDWLGPLVEAAICDPAALSQGLRSSNALSLGGLGLIIGGQPITRAATPGVVQALGNPFKPGSNFTAVADGSASEILVRAQDKGVTVVDRFANLGLTAGQRIEVTISPGPNGPIVLAGQHRPVEERRLESAPQ